MAKQPGPGECVHCLGSFRARTWDHLFPEAWYPDTTPANTEKWKFPSCKPCNAEYGKIERRLFQQLALGTDPWLPAASGIGERAFRSFAPDQAKNEKDKQHRRAALAKLRRSTRRQRDISGTLLPNIGRFHDPDPDTGEHTVSEVDSQDVRRLVEKIVRGITYLRHARLITPEYEIKVLTPSAVSQIPQFILDSPYDSFERLPGFVVHRHHVPENDLVAFFRFFLWDRYEFIAGVIQLGVGDGA